MMFDHRGHNLGVRPPRPSDEREKIAQVVSSVIGDDTLVWMYERLTHPDRRRFFTLERPADRLMFLVNGGSNVREAQNDKTN